MQRLSREIAPWRPSACRGSQAVRRRVGRRPPRLRGRPGDGDRLPRPQRGRQDHHPADAARPGRPDLGRGHHRRPALPAAGRPGPAGRGRAGAERVPSGPLGSRPPAGPGHRGRAGPGAGRRGPGADGAAAAARRRVGGFSLGMRQRLGLAAALLGDPDVLVLDEPANGLDPEGVHWLRGLVRGLADQGRTVLVSSHLLAEVDQTVDQVVIIDRGRLGDQATLAALTAGADRTVRVRTAQPEALRGLLVARGATVTLDGPEQLLVGGVTAEQVGQAAAPAASCSTRCASNAPTSRTSSSSSPAGRETNHDPARPGRAAEALDHPDRPRPARPGHRRHRRPGDSGAGVRRPARAADTRRRCPGPARPGPQRAAHPGRASPLASSAWPASSATAPPPRPSWSPRCGAGWWRPSWPPPPSPVWPWPWWPRPWCWPSPCPGCRPGGSRWTSPIPAWRPGRAGWWPRWRCT